jgi:hypothetical protein
MSKVVSARHISEWTELDGTVVSWKGDSLYNSHDDVAGLAVRLFKLKPAALKASPDLIELHESENIQNYLLKGRMEDLFAKGGTLYFSDLAEKMDLDLETVVMLAKELMKEGKIKIDGTR